MSDKIKNPYRVRNKYRETYCTTLRKVLEYTTSKYWNRDMSQFVDGEQKYTYSSFKEKCDMLSTRMSRFGISAGDKVAILSQNMPNWTLAFFAATAFGRVAIPILPDSSENEVTNILNHSESKVIFISKKLMYKLNQECIDKLTLVVDIETLEFVKCRKEDFQCNGWVKSPQPDDLATIIYTSGTTGKAKGVMLSHRNICHNLVASFKAQPCFKRDRFLSILPMAHAYEMCVSSLYSMYVGACCYYLSKPPTPSILLPAMHKVKPTIMLAVPLIIEKIYHNSVVPTIAKSRLLRWMDQHMPKILYWFIGRQLVSKFGGKLRFFGVGGSKIDTKVEDFLIKCHFPYAVGYGLTETAPLVCNVIVTKRKRLGSIGVASYKVEVRLDNVDPKTGEGEIVCRGDNVMLGYYKDPERTIKVLDEDGWFRTGDIASMDKDGYYYIKGRLNNTILGPSGENIYPEEIEMVINDIEGVDESLVMEKNGALIALVKFDDNVLDWNQETEDQFFEKLDSLKKSVQEFVNKAVGKNSKIDKVEAMKDPFEKTATQKIRRFKYAENAKKSEEKKEDLNTQASAEKDENHPEG
ncbi:MAG: AMP-binding protein [Bacteroidales bacterium]|nr:AMP-binding protein [Bacteroidales bacterium]